MKDVMIDIETMSTRHDAAILSISACYFDLESGEIGKTFDQQVSLENNIAGERHIDANTLLWWLEQDEAARKQFKDIKNAPKLIEVLREFSTFIRPNSNVRVWGNGASFDLTIITTAYVRCKMKAPWIFWNERDVRTMVHVGQSIGFDPKRDFPFVGTRHNALDDSKHQAKYVSAIYNLIQGSKK